MKNTTTQDNPSMSLIQFAGEELSDWAARQPHIGPANDSRIRSALETGFWLQANAKLIVKSVNEYAALCAVADAAEAGAIYMKGAFRVDMENALANLAAVRNGGAK